MHILHGTWIPDATASFVQSGSFYIWAESIAETQQSAQLSPVNASQLVQMLTDELPLKSLPELDAQADIEKKYVVVPASANVPLPSLETARYLELDLPAPDGWQTRKISCYRLNDYIKGRQTYRGLSALLPQLKELHFIAKYQLTDIQLGSDLLFWHAFTQTFKQVLFKDQYIPALRYQTLPAKRKGRTIYETYPYWEIVSEAYERAIADFSQFMPGLCLSVHNSKNAADQYAAEQLLRHCCECLLNDIVTRTDFSQGFYKQIEGSLIYSCLKSAHWRTNAPLELYQEWTPWRDRIARSQLDTLFYLCFQLVAPADPSALWQLNIQVAPKDHPSLRIALEHYWQLKPHQQAALRLQLGEQFETHLLYMLGDAARIYPPLWQGLETDRPSGIQLDVDAAFDFLQEAAWVLEDAGCKVIIPSWWTPSGRRRAKLKLKASARENPEQEGQSENSKSYVSFDSLISYEYELSIGGESVSEQEWRALVASQAPLVQFRGEWIALNPDKMKEMLAFWNKQQSEDNPDISVLNFMQMAAQQGEDVEVDFSRDRVLTQMMDRLNHVSALVPIDDPQHFEGHLRDYQRRGVAWLQYLDQLGLNGCLADDMGLGKTVQVIARMLQEEETLQTHRQKKRQKTSNASPALPPTLLVAPTSVLGNWQREVERFAPNLTAMVHHGSDRAKQKAAFKKRCRQHHLIITSFALARRDLDLINSVQWHRIVLDEAQNIKNPKTAQTKAILKLTARHRLALTGTPIENRLLDLWSIFNFLNPGYLGKASQFRKQFELPIQRNSDPTQSAVLKKLVEPFILRRVKTDEAIIKDLPSKVEQKLYCNLTKEQASLYEATVRDVEKKLQAAEGIQRKGLILSTLMKLKQICNHPAQFLQDGSDFTAVRSHKLSRLTDMVEEAISDGDSLLIFTQFREIGDALDAYLHRTHHYNTYYLHGGTSRKKRDDMMQSFQSDQSGPSIFILSLKAGGVGITLTKANHVFHFDRWWNPAVEDQATDRAFRIGQKKNVFVHKFISIGTLEERIDQMIEDKKKLAGSIVGSDESWLTELDNDAFKQLIALNKQAILD